MYIYSTPYLQVTNALGLQNYYIYKNARYKY